MATSLYGSWRLRPPPFNESLEELNPLIPLLIRTGAAGLCWRRIRHSPLGASDECEPLQKAFKLQMLRASLQYPQIKRIFRLMRRFDVEPILGKGWAVSRLYPERGMRSTGDIDLYVRPEQYILAWKLLGTPEASGCQVDLHDGCSSLADQSFDEIYRHSQLVNLEETEVRVFGFEDHLRLLSIHMMAHGAWRPLWLTDVALVAESLPEDFDWNYFLKGNARRTDAVMGALCLARDLLGADLQCAPEDIRRHSIPEWMKTAVLKAWGNPKTPHGMRAPLRSLIGQPRELFKGLWLRWPNPLEASVNVGAPFNNFPRLFFQLEECCARSWRFLFQSFRRLPGNRSGGRERSQSEWPAPREQP